MLPVDKLTGLVLRQIIGGTAEEVAQVIKRHWTDHSQTLPRALARAHERAWQALGIALTGDGFVDQVRVFFSSGDDKGLREQIRIFLESSPLPEAMTATQFRRACLEDLKRLRLSGLVSTSTFSVDQVAREAKSFQRYTDSGGLIEGANQVVVHIAQALSPDYPNLAKLVSTPTPSGPALLPSAFAYFFRREVETNQGLSQGLVFSGLENLLASQNQGFSEIHQVLETLGNQLDQVFDQLGRIEAEIVETQTIAAATHGAVLDLQGEMQRWGHSNLAGFREIRALLGEVASRLAKAGMPRGEVKLQHSLSIRNEDERLAIKALLVRFRKLPTKNQKEMPALLNGLGKLQIGTGDFAGARQTFEEVAHAVGEVSAQAEAWFNAYLAALEKKSWEEALQAIHRATALDPARFAPFPVQRYQPKRILGAGGFGTAFLCYDRNFDDEVVVKTLYAADMERNMAEVFQEARVLRRLSHPAIIGVHECEFADPDQSLRPYIVMDYFPGISLEQHLQENGPLSPEDLLPVARQLASGMLAAHRQNILHRDLKPDNVLLRRQEGSWQIKLIDFGLALRRQTVETSQAVRSAGNTILSDSVAGTLKYAPPEQMGELKGVRTGPYSDIFSFGKTCCYALFQTTEPKRRQWATIPEELSDLLERCTEHQVENRPTGFDAILEVLQALPFSPSSDGLPGKVADKPFPTEPATPKLEPIPPQQEREARFIQLIRETLQRNRGKTLREDYPEIVELCRQYRIPGERAREIIQQVKGEGPGPSTTSPVYQPGEIITNFQKMKFAWIPPGSFLMGSPPGEEGHDTSQDFDETQHRVTLTKGFFMGIHLVTRGHFAKFAQATGHTTEAEIQGGVYYQEGAEWKLQAGFNWRNPSFYQTVDHPALCVSWNDGQAFCQWLTAEDPDGRHYRLPTEAEWEYACRAGTTTTFCFGDTLSTDQANFDGTTVYGKGKKGINRGQTTPVGSFPPNAWGLFDIHGNAGEWCQNWSGPYPEKPVIDYKGPGSGQFHIVRGGGWASEAVHCRSADRWGAGPSFRQFSIGFRICFDSD